MPEQLEPLSKSLVSESARFCKRLTRRTAGNFYYSFLTLPRADRRDMSILYAFMRHCDDIGDTVGLPLEERRNQLVAWKSTVERALSSQQDLEHHPLLPAFVDLVARKEIPHAFLFAVIEGVERDLDNQQIETFPQLEEYCYHVAGVVGRCCIHLWGLKPGHEFPDVYPLADACGLAFQLTNILRDLQEDAEMQRVYLPQVELNQFEMTVDHFLAGNNDAAFKELMQFQVQRAREYYQEAEKLFEVVSPTGHPVLSAMIKIYGGLLTEIENRHYDVFTKRVRHSFWTKVKIVLETVFLRRT